MLAAVSASVSAQEAMPLSASLPKVSAVAKFTLMSLPLFKYKVATA